MSHTVTRTTACTNMNIVQKTAQKLSIKVLERSAHGVTTGKNGLVLQMKHWRYPLAIDASGKLLADSDDTNNKAAQDELAGFTQRYAIEAAWEQAAIDYPNASIYDEVLPNGDLRLCVELQDNFGNQQETAFAQH